jgi:hypothetical protein
LKNQTLRTQFFFATWKIIQSTVAGRVSDPVWPSIRIQSQVSRSNIEDSKILLKKYFVKLKNSNKFYLGLNEGYPSSRSIKFSGKNVQLSFLWVIIAFLEPEPPDPIYKRMVQDAIKSEGTSTLKF